MKVILHGFLRDRFKEMEIVADTVAEVIEGWSRQCGLADLPMHDRPILEILGLYNPEDYTEKSSLTEIHIVPSMFGGGGKFGTILMGAALIGLSFALPGIGVALSATMQSALIAAGIGMVAGGVMQLFMKSPSVSASNDPDPSKYLGSSGNTTAIGTLIPKGYGRFKLGGQYLSLQVNAQDMVFGTFPATA